MRFAPLLRCLVPLLACAPLAPAADAWATLARESCVSCHSGSEPEGGLSLESLAEQGLGGAELSVLDRLHALLRTGAMPPPEEPRPDAALIANVLDAVERERDRRATEAAHPGRVTMRRLNRTEYNCTIRDLFGLRDFRPADDFPADDVGYGFDNIGDVLMLPPALVERYLLAAERVAERAIFAQETYLAPRLAWSGLEFTAVDGAAVGQDRGIQCLASNGEVSHDLTLDLDGEYELVIRASGDQAGDDPPRMVVRLIGDGFERELGEYDIEGRRRKPQEERAKVKLPPGQYALRIGFTNDFYEPDPEGKKHRDRNLNLHGVEILGPLGITESGLPASHRQLVPRIPAATDDWSAVARETLRPFLRRAYRRSVTDAEVDRVAALTKLAQDNGESYERGMQLAVTAALTSPEFLFHVERPAGSPAGNREPLGDFELANRLSYFLWSSLPDEQLLDLAEQGRLGDPEVLAEQARRLLADPRSEALVENFAAQWLHLRELWRLTPDPQRFPDFDEELRAAMWGETRSVFEHIVREDRGLLELIDADYTFLNERLARHYGIEGVSGPEFRRVALTDRRRGGLLTQAAVLTVTSNPTRTSPVKRGKWVLEQLLGEAPPAPPPGVPQLADDTSKQELTGTLRQRMEQHRADPSCAVCHRRMDAVGFGLENFDPIGAWREAEGGAAIDASAELAPGQAFAGPVELKALLSAEPASFYQTLSRKLLTYALGRGLELHDRLAVDKIATGLAESEGRFSRLITEIVLSEPFRYRRVEGAES